MTQKTFLRERIVYTYLDGTSVYGVSFSTNQWAGVRVVFDFGKRSICLVIRKEN
jgi:hypothetical protein